MFAYKINRIPSFFINVRFDIIEEVWVRKGTRNIKNRRGFLICTLANDTIRGKIIHKDIHGGVIREKETYDNRSIRCNFVNRM